MASQSGPRQDTAGNGRHEEAHGMQALVTGASRGIGKAIAIALAEQGFDVAVAARTLRASDATAEHTQTVHKVDTRPLPGSIEETAAAIEATGQRALPLQMDLTDLATVEAATQKLLDEWGGVDLVVNNGRHIGPGIMDTILDTPIEQYPLFLMAHGVAPIRITQMLLPGMLERGQGTFVTISSGAGYMFYPPSPRPGLGYRIGKAAGHTLVGSIQAEHGDKGIRAFNVDPGFVLTERNSLDVEEFGFDPSWAGPPAAIGAAVVWLVTSPDADELQRTDISAQPLVLERGLYPDWRPALA
jgi:NAD(P)-dependent dehydrogenase (short-subunit alcohol dehydrogenase family)